MLAGLTYSIDSSKFISGSKGSIPRLEPDMTFNPMASPGLAPDCSAGMELKVAIALSRADDPSLAATRRC